MEGSTRIIVEQYADGTTSIAVTQKPNTELVELVTAAVNQFKASPKRYHERQPEVGGAK